jgi:hypothetical protein
VPTAAEFEAAADMFAAVAERVGVLTAEAVGARPADILRGGSLGRQVPERIHDAAQTANHCREQILAAERECRRRAGVIEDYLSQLEIYDRAHARYEIDVSYWDVWFNRWIRDPATSSNPGPRPIPPTPPAPPPSWAEVRRP